MLVSAVVAEDHDMTRQGIRSLLEDQLEARVSATTGDGLDVFPLLEEHHPDLLVLDLGLPNLNGLDVLRKIRERSLSVQIVVLSMHGQDTYVSKAFELGTSGYVLKGAPRKELVDAIQTVIEGGRYLSNDLSEDLLDSPGSGERGTGNRYERLTDREREVFQLTVEGRTSKEIGEHLYISPRTVDKHRENIRKKLGLENVAEMIAYAHRRGIIADKDQLENED